MELFLWWLAGFWFLDFIFTGMFLTIVIIAIFCTVLVAGLKFLKETFFLFLNKVLNKF